MYVWEAESDAVLFYDFGAGRSDQEEYEQDGTDSKYLAFLFSHFFSLSIFLYFRSNKSGGRFSSSLLGRQPVNCCWDANDSRLLFCEAVSAAGVSKDIVDSAIIAGERVTIFLISDFQVEIDFFQ